MRRSGAIFGVLTLGAALWLAMGVTASAQQKRFTTIASARPGGSWYITGAGWAEFLNKYVPGIEARVEQSGGGVHNNKLVAAGDADFAPSVARLTALAMKGQGPFKGGNYADIRVLVSNWTMGVLQYPTLESSGLTTLCDLKGKRITLGPEGGGGIPAALAAFEVCGFSQKDVTASFLSYEAGKDALLDGNVDAFLTYAAVPVPAVQALAATPGVTWRLLSLDGDKVKMVEEKFPGYVRYVVGAKAYGLPHDTVTIGAPNILITNAKLSEDFIYQVTKLMMERLDEFVKIHPAHKEMSRELSAKAVAGLPFHPGAIRYYKEAGLM